MKKQQGKEDKTPQPKARQPDEKKKEDQPKKEGQPAQEKKENQPKEVIEEMPVPPVDILVQNAGTLAREITWFANEVNSRLMEFSPNEKIYGLTDTAETEIVLEKDQEYKNRPDLTPPDLRTDHSVYA